MTLKVSGMPSNRQTLRTWSQPTYLFFAARSPREAMAAGMDGYPTTAADGAVP